MQMQLLVWCQVIIHVVHQTDILGAALLVVYGEQLPDVLQPR